MPNYGTDYFYKGYSGYHIYDVNYYNGKLWVNIVCIAVESMYTSDESGFDSPVMGTYCVYDGIDYRLVDQGENSALQTWDDYHDFAVNYDFSSKPDLWQVELACDYGEDGYHLCKW